MRRRFTLLLAAAALGSIPPSLFAQYPYPAPMYPPGYGPMPVQYVAPTVSGTTPAQPPAIGVTLDITSGCPSGLDEGNVRSPNTCRGLSNQFGKYGVTCRLPLDRRRRYSLSAPDGMPDRTSRTFRNKIVGVNGFDSRVTLGFAIPWCVRMPSEYPDM